MDKWTHKEGTTKENSMIENLFVSCTVLIYYGYYLILSIPSLYLLYTIIFIHITHLHSLVWQLLVIVVYLLTYFICNKLNRLTYLFIEITISRHLNILFSAFQVIKMCCIDRKTYWLIPVKRSFICYWFIFFYQILSFKIMQVKVIENTVYCKKYVDCILFLQISTYFLKRISSKENILLHALTACETWRVLNS